MTALRLVLGLLVIALCLPPPAVRAEIAESSDCLVLDIHQIGHPRLAALVRTSGVESWLELDDELFVCGSTTALATLAEGVPVKRSLGALSSERLRLTYKMSRAEIEQLGLRILASGGLFTVVEAPESIRQAEERAAGILPFRSPQVLARQVANQPPREVAVVGEGTVANLVEQVDAARWFSDVDSLAAYNRYTLGEEIDGARKWLRRQFRRLPGVKVESGFFFVGDARVANVIATLPGRSRPDDWFIVGAHYDSTSDDPFTAAPGAEDNASGCAGVLEIARIFAANPPEATVLFICYAGEEQGLIGSATHAAELLASGDAEKIGAMLNLDMIGFTEDDDLDCLLQARPEDQFLIDALTDSAMSHTQLRLVTSNVIGGSDHVPYALSEMPAVLSIEADTGAYLHYHRATDTPDKLTPEMAAEILRMNVGALARFTGNSDVTGCLNVGEEPLAGVRVVATQAGEPRLRDWTTAHGCFAVDPLTREKTFKLRIRGPELSGDEPNVSACIQVLGDPPEGRQVVFRQPGEAGQRVRSDTDGCFAFEATSGKRFNLIFKGPVVGTR